MVKQIMMVALGYVIATAMMFCGFIALAYLRNALGKAVFGLSVVLGFSTMILFLYWFNNPRCSVCGKAQYKWYELFKVQKPSDQCHHCQGRQSVDRTNENSS